MEYKCNNCGHILKEQSEFCPNCGAKMNYIEEAKATLVKPSKLGLIFGIVSLSCVAVPFVAPILLLLAGLVLIPLLVIVSVITLGLGLIIAIPILIIYVLLITLIPLLGLIAGIVFGVLGIINSQKPNHDKECKDTALILSIVGTGICSLLLLSTLVSGIVKGISKLISKSAIVLVA